MSSSKRVDTIKDMLEPAVNAVGMVLWGVEYLQQGKHSVLRLFIDSEKGVTVDDCAAVSHQVSGILDVEDPIGSEYNLEVSSPGMDRPIFTFQQFVDYVGEDFKLKLRSAVDEKRNFVGKLLKAENEILVFSVDGCEIELTMMQIDRANLFPRFD